jgi:hypothetical protein
LILRYPSSKYPVIAFSSAPAAFPVVPQNRQLQSFFKWTKTIENDAETFVKMHINRPSVGIHLRNNVDWVVCLSYFFQIENIFLWGKCLFSCWCKVSFLRVITMYWRQFRVWTANKRNVFTIRGANSKWC